MVSKNVYFYDFSLCRIGIAEENSLPDGGEAICRIFFGDCEIQNDFEIKEYEKSETPLIKKAAIQLAEYFENKRNFFDLPLNPHGTNFQLNVWNALKNIPYGETRTYGEIARMTGNPKACRAVGMANNRNPIAIIIPCHRVIGSDGSLTGYAGGLELKRKLLELEQDRKNAQIMFFS